MDSNPIGIFFATSWTNGEKLIFRYPNLKENTKDDQHKNSISTNNYALCPSLIPRLSVYKPYEFSHIKNSTVEGFPDDQLASMLVKVQMIKRRFELKISDVLFVGYMNKVVRKVDEMEVCFNVLFALQSNTDPFLIGRYQDVCEMIGLALIHEEGRTSYLSNQKQEILDLHENHGQSSSMTSCQLHDKVSNTTSLGCFFRLAYEQIVYKGSVDMYLNKWIRISYCVYPRVGTYFQLHSKSAMFGQPSMLENYLNAVRPYHTFIMLEELKVVIERLSEDSSPVLRRVLLRHSPTKNLSCLAAELDVALLQVRKVVCTLVLWGFVMVVYPVYDTNVYLVSPHAPLSPHSLHSLRFASRFPDLSLVQVLSEFSTSYDLNYHRNNIFKLAYNNANYREISAQVYNQLVKVITWLLKHNLVFQLHKYIYRINNDNNIDNIDNSNIDNNIDNNNFDNIDNNNVDNIDNNNVDMDNNNIDQLDNNNNNNNDSNNINNHIDNNNYNQDDGGGVGGGPKGSLDNEQQTFISFKGTKEQTAKQTTKQTTSLITSQSTKQSTNAALNQFSVLASTPKATTTPLLTTSSTTIDSNSPLTSTDLSWKSDDAFPTGTPHHHPHHHHHLPLHHNSPNLNSPHHHHSQSLSQSVNSEVVLKEDGELFSRLSGKYFGGEHHLEHIMFCEHLPRARLSSIIDRFRDQLVICQHEELHISYWVSQNS